jgi:hypothetical protein
LSPLYPARLDSLWTYRYTCIKNYFIETCYKNRVPVAVQVKVAKHERSELDLDGRISTVGRKAKGYNVFSGFKSKIKGGKQ